MMPTLSIHSSSRIAPFFLGLLTVADCEGRLAPGPDAGGDATDIADASNDFGPVDDAGNTACTTSAGQQVCGPATPCPSCLACACFFGDVGVCNPTYGRPCDEWCAADDACWMTIIDDAGNEGMCVPFSVGQLLSKYSTDTRIVSYADLSTWTGAPIPEPATCPSVSGFQLCGGACGGCSGSDVCGGRSPLHPWGVCVPVSFSLCGLNGVCKQSGDACFVFAVDPASQWGADRNGHCMPAAQCQAMASQLPGGGKCF